MGTNGDPVFAAIDTSTMSGLEIGPLTNPKVRKSDGRIAYLDHASTEDLRAKYAPNQQLASSIDQLVEVDIVQGPTQSLAEAVGTEATFDYVIAAHVIEHIPNTIGWLRDVEAVLKVGGILSLVVPDKRFTFDVNRTPTELSEFIDAHLRDLRYPSVRQIFDFFSRTVTIDGMVDTAGLWGGTVDYRGVVRDDVSDAAVHAYQVCRQQAANPSTLDIHCHVFTPESFAAMFEGLVRLGLTDFEVVELFPTARDTLEFHVSLRKLDGADMGARQTAPLRALLSDTPPRPGSVVSQPISEHVNMPVSRHEEQLVLGKRRVMGALRGLQMAFRVGERTVS